MKVELLKYPKEEDLMWVKTCTLNTVGKKATTLPTEEWLDRLIQAEHSPIRELVFGFKLTIPSWVSVHLVRHHVGINHYVKTQRTDRTGVDRNQLPQGSEVSHIISLNLQSLIQLAHKRLCYQASPETREVVREMCNEAIKVLPCLKNVLVPLCVYRNGKCTEMYPCKEMENYRK